MATAVHFGAGNIGRGFIGDLLHESGYRVVFLDVDDAMVAAINAAGGYDLYLLDHDLRKKVVDNVAAISLKDRDAAIAAITTADLVTTAVWASNLDKIAPLLAHGLKARAEAAQPRINVMACENAMFASRTLREEILKTGVIDTATLDAAAAFPNTAVDRVVIGTQRDGRPTVDVADYHELAVERDALVDPHHPPIAAAKYADDLEKFLQRKLYVVNCGHAWAGLVGYIHGYTSVRDVFLAPDLVPQVRETMVQAARFIEDKYGFTHQEMLDYVDLTVSRYQVPGVDYSVAMVTRAPIRKISPDDRLVGPAVGCEERGFENGRLLQGIALALLLDRSDDPEAVELQQYLQEHGVGAAIAHYTGIPVGTRMHDAILNEFDEQQKVRDSFRTRASAPAPIG